LVRFSEYFIAESDPRFRQPLNRAGTGFPSSRRLMRRAICNAPHCGMSRCEAPWTGPGFQIGKIAARPGLEILTCCGQRTMATPNYSFEKRRRELDKKAKKEEKRKRKAEGGSASADEPADDAAPAEVTGEEAPEAGAATEDAPATDAAPSEPAA